MTTFVTKLSKRLDEDLDDRSRLPEMILLDLNLPGLSGLDVLNAVKTNDGLVQIPVIVMTSSTAPTDVRAAYTGHANSFISKTIQSDESSTPSGHWNRIG